MFNLICRWLESYHRRLSHDLLLDADAMGERAAHHRRRAEFWSRRRTKGGNAE